LDASSDHVDVATMWKPSDLGDRLVVWLEADAGVVLSNSGIQTWADQSGLRNDAIPGGTKRPTLVMNAIHDKPAVAFDGPASDQFLTIVDASALRWGTGDFAVVAVASWTNAPSTNEYLGYGVIWSKTESPDPFRGLALFGNDGIAGTGAVRAQLTIDMAVSTTAISYNDGRFHRVGARRTNGTLEVRADGTSATVANIATDIDSIGYRVMIGGRYGDLQMLAGQIAEIIAINGTLTDPELVQIETYLAEKYGL
jgi:hypothetical protein